MALTRDLLKANAALSGLTDAQIEAITTLSANDENDVIAKKTGEIYGKLDEDIKGVSGVEKNGSEKTYEYAKRVLGDFKTKADGANGLQTQIDSLTKEKARLEKTIAEGAVDKETVKQLKQAQADLASVTKQYNDLNTEFTTAKANHEKEMFGFRIDSELKGATVGLKFKAGLPESVTKVILQQATDKVKGMNPEYIDDGKGGKILAFKDQTGAIMRNPNNQLNPFTPGELVKRELEAMDVLDKGRQQSGAGSKGGAGGAGGAGGTIVDVSGARTRMEAHDIISENLMAQGLTVGSKAYDDAMHQAWVDNNVSNLPEQ